MLAGCSSDPAPGTTPGKAGSGNAAAGSSPGTGGKPAGSGGSTSSGGSGNTTSSGGTATGSGGTATGSGGTATGSGGSPSGGAGGAADPNGPDQMGKTNAKPGDMASTKFDYLKMGEIRILNNNWGSVAAGCATPQSVFVAADGKSFGWSFDRGSCDASGQRPDFPQLEFGIHPFGLGSSDATSPNFSSTTLLPLQIKDITSASVTLTDLKIQFDKKAKWDLTFEFWLSSKDPGKTQGDAGVYAELMTFWGWETNRWPDTDGSGMTLVRNSTCTGGSCPKGGDQVTAGKSYKLTVQDDAWGKWRYFQFRDRAGSHESFGTLTVDVKKLIDYLVSKGYSKDLWVSRLEVGSEIDDNNKGTVTMKNVEFEVNGQKRSPVFGK